MTTTSPLWGAELDHIRLDSDNPEQLAAFYRDAFAMAENHLDDGSRLLQGRDRRLIIGAGATGEQPYSAFRLPDENPHLSLSTTLEIPLKASGDNPIWVCVTTEDGFQAWSSPIYAFK